MGHKITVKEVNEVLAQRPQITVASAANAGKGKKVLLCEPGNGLFSITSDGHTSFTRVVEDAVKLYNSL